MPNATHADRDSFAGFEPTQIVCVPQSSAPHGGCRTVSHRTPELRVPSWQIVAGVAIPLLECTCDVVWRNSAAHGAAALGAGLLWTAGRR